MVKIRLKRMGTTKRPVYRLVVADSRSPRDGRFIEAIGFYDPLPDPALVRVDEEKVRTWMRRGARPSDSARQLLVQQGILQAPARPARPKTAAAPAAGEGPVASSQSPAPSEPVPEEAVEANPAPVIEEAATEDGETQTEDAGNAKTGGEPEGPA